MASDLPSAIVVCKVSCLPGSSSSFAGKVVVRLAERLDSARFRKRTPGSRTFLLPVFHLAGKAAILHQRICVSTSPVWIGRVKCQPRKKNKRVNFFIMRFSVISLQNTIFGRFYWPVLISNGVGNLGDGKETIKRHRYTIAILSVRLFLCSIGG